VGDSVALIPLQGTGTPVRSRVTKLYAQEGLERVEVETASAGEIVALAGLEGVEIGSTVTDPEHAERLEGISVEEPTISVDFVINNSPFAGKEGKFVTSRQVRDRLYKELERNVALRVEDTDSTDAWQVSGRGELHLSILMETMRREGYEFQVSRPRVILKTGVNGERLEPYEELTIDVPEDYLGAVMEKLGQRRAEMIEMKNPGQGLVRLMYRIPARGLFGYRSEFLTDTRGTGILHHSFLEYGPWAGPLAGRNRGVLVSMEAGAIVGFALQNLQERSTLFVSPGDAVYEGMVVGENSRPGDMDVNPTKEKKLTNMRSKATDENISLEPPRVLTLESALEYIEDDELIEVTPQSIRLRKRMLSATDRKRTSRDAKKERDARPSERRAARPRAAGPAGCGGPARVWRIARRDHRDPTRTSKEILVCRTCSRAPTPPAPTRPIRPTRAPAARGAPRDARRRRRSRRGERERRARRRPRRRVRPTSTTRR
jgi:GTP-binding protein